VPKFAKRTSPKLVADRLTGMFPAEATTTDPELFLTGLIELMSSYPDWVQERSLSAVNGLPAKFKFLPTLAEIKEELDIWVDADRRHRDIQDRWSKPRLPPGEDAPAEQKPSYEELVEKYGRNFGIRNPDAIARKSP
jgi:hypothetical protein